MHMGIKRTIALFLSVIMLLGILPFDVFNRNNDTDKEYPLGIMASAMNALGEYTIETDPDKITAEGAYTYNVDASTFSGIYALDYMNYCKWLQINSRKYDADWLEAYDGNLADYNTAVASQGQGASDLAGAEYTLYYYEYDDTGAEIVVPVETAVTDALGYFSFQSVTLGRNYFIQETKAAPGYEIDPNRHYVNYDPAATDEEDNTIEADAYTEYIDVFADYVQRAPIVVIKRDSVLESDIISPQGDATLAQPKIFEIKYYGPMDLGRIDSIYNRYDNMYSYNDYRTYRKGEIVEYITTDADGVAQTSDLPYGWYQITEITSPEGYINEHHSTIVPNFQDGEARVTYINFTDTVERAFLDIRKADIHDEIGYMPEGDTTLIGAKFTVQNSSMAPVTFSGDQRNVGEHTEWNVPDGTAANGDYIYNPGTDICTVTTFNENGETDVLEMPFGTYTIRETVTPHGYLSDAEPQTVSLYDNGERKHIKTEPTLVTFKNTPQSTTIEIDKKDIETWDAAQGDGKINDMTVAIVNRSVWPVYYRGNVIDPGEEVCRLITDDTGYVKSDPLPYGTYEVIEIVAPYGYEPVGDDIHFINSNYDIDGTILSEGTYIGVRDPIQRGTLRVSKYDTETGDINQGDATFVGTTFQIYNASRRPVYLSTAQQTGDSRYVTYESGTYYKAHDGTHGSLYYRGDLICTVVTDEYNGTVAVDIPNLPFGEYEVVETVPPRGYWINDGADESEGGDAYRKYFQLYNGLESRPVIYETTYANAEDSVKRGKISITKRDDYTDAEEGAGTLAGAEFTIINRSMQPVFLAFGEKYVDDAASLAQNLYDPGEVVQRIYTDENGYAESLPLAYGTYEIVETGAPEGYLIGVGDGQTGEGNSITTLTYEFENNVYGDIIPMQNYEWYDSAIRGDLALQKVNTSQKTLPNIVFRVTSLTTGESHIIVTDENGEINTNSGRYLHSVNTNINDNAVDAEGNVDESLLDPHAGVWFTGRSDIQLTPDDMRGALPYDTYHVEELRSSANIDIFGRELKLLEFDVRVSAPGYTIDYGTLSDLNPVAITTKLTDHNNSGHISALSERTNLDETISLQCLEIGKTYTIETKLVDEKTGEPVIDNSGNQVSETYTFTAQNEEAENIIIKLIFDSRNLSGRKVVATDTVTVEEKGEKVCAAVHDLSSMDAMQIESQSVYFPGIGTTLTTEDGAKIALAATETLVDTVEYTGLEAGTTYQLKAVLMLKSTGKPALDANGNGIEATTTFVAENSDGIAEVIFKNVDLSNLAKESLVCFETLSVYPDGRIIAVHEDIEDEDQTIIIGWLRTTATNENMLKSIGAEADQTIIDTIAYENLEKNTAYTVTTDILDISTMSSILDGPVETTAVTSDSGAGTFEIIINVDASEFAGKTLVVYETVSKDGTVVAEHCDKEDEAQYVYVPEIKTYAESKAGNKEIPACREAVILDTVKYRNLVPGESYKVSGAVYNKTTGEYAAAPDGNLLTAELEFVPQEADGEVVLEFRFDATDEKNRGSLVAFETLYEVSGETEKEVGKHEDENDEDQTVTVPFMSTTATSEDRKTHDVPADEEIMVVDTVEYSGLVPGKQYTLFGSLMNREDGMTVLDDNGNPVQTFTEFVPEESDGETEVIFRFRKSEIAGMTLVAFETLYCGNAEEITDDTVPLISHSDIEDEAQTVYVPKIITNAANAGGLKGIEAAPDQTVIDKVTYENLIPGEEYTLVGTLYSKNDTTGKTMVPVRDSDGSNVTTEVRFIAVETGNGTVEVRFVFDASNYAADKLVAGEQLFSADGKLKASHEDINDEDQTIFVPKIRTSAVADNNTKRLAENNKNGKIVDTITYENLVVGETYTVYGVLMDQNTGEPLKISGKEVREAKTVVASAEDGSFEMVFDVDNSELREGNIVVFEKIMDQSGKTVAVHEDINDDAQAVYSPARVDTTATGENGEKVLPIQKRNGTVIIKDTVKYSGLIPGKKYTITGVLMDKETGTTVKDETGKVVRSEPVILIPTEEDGEAEVMITAPSYETAGKKVVVYEYITAGELTVGSHEDINDDDQTVQICFMIDVYKYDGLTDQPLPGVTFIVSDRTAALEAGVFEVSADMATDRSTAEEIREFIEEPDKFSDIITTDKNGNARFAGIPDHEYILKEVKAPSGYKIDWEMKDIIVEEDGTAAGDIKIINLPKGTVVITKYDAVTREPVEGAEIEIRDPNGKVISTRTTDKQGNVYFLPEMAGKYTYRETKAPTGYYVNTDTYMIQIMMSPDGEYTAAGNLSFVDAKEGTIVVTKTTVNGTRLPGAMIGFYNSAGTKLGSGVTDNDGHAYFQTPGPGTYYFIEETAPKGYLRNTATFKVTITPDKTIEGSTVIVDKPDTSPQTSDDSGYNNWKTGRMLSAVVAVLSAVGLAARALMFPLRKKKGDTDS